MSRCGIRKGRKKKIGISKESLSSPLNRVYTDIDNAIESFLSPDENKIEKDEDKDMFAGRERS